jgi:Glycosyltransferase 61
MTMTWDDTKRSQLRAVLLSEAADALNLISHTRLLAQGHERVDLGNLLSLYIQGACSIYDHLQYEIRQVINEIGIRDGFLAPGESFFGESFVVKRSFVASLCPQLIGALYALRTNADLEGIPLLEPCPNELADNGIPPPMNMLLHRPDRPAMRAYASRDAVVYAHPFRYQILSKDRTAMWASGSPRSLSRMAIGDPETITVAGDVIVLQDRFNFANFSHFLFDGITRALLLHERLGTLRSSILVFGGVPGDYQNTVCRALADALDLDVASVYFPDRPVIFETSQRCIWFSDQVETYLHPAQMAHPASINLLRSVAEAIPGDPCEYRRVYVSRADAEQRRVVNEDRISAALAARGFATVQLSQLSIAQQVGLFREAEVIVAPHGMGLVHLAMANRLKGVVELFSPRAGTDAYAFIAKAGRIAHTCIVGADVGSPVADFEVSLDQINRCLDTIEADHRLPSWRKPANLLTGSRSFSGFRAEEGCADAGISVPELIWGSRVFGHCARGGPTQGGAVVGGWGGVQLMPGVRYTASCWVWITDRSAETEVSLGLAECVDVQIIGADLARRDIWQRISTSGVASLGFCDVELRVSSPSNISLGSTCWQLERGDVPTAYVETP